MCYGTGKVTPDSAGFELKEMPNQTWTRRGWQSTSPNSPKLLGHETGYPHSQSHIYAGRAGSDLMQAGVSDDIIHAGKGDDITLGGDGNDTIYTGKE